jgi:hypothetical protein
MLERIDIKYFPISDELLNILMDIQDKGGYIAGGYARHLICGSPYSDIDIFTNSPTAKVRIMKLLKDKKYLSNPIRSKIYGFKVYAYKYRIGDLDKNITEDIQIVEQAVHPHKVIDTFDFTVCQVYADLFEGVCYADPRFVEDYINKRLVYNYIDKDRPPVSLIYRVKEYIDKGYEISKEDVFELYKNVVDKHSLLYQIETFIPDHELVKSLRVIFELSHNKVDVEFF